jgi:dihydroflavonol-4-reductase
VRALVTGATGFVSANVARVLVEQGHSVSALVRATSDRGALAGLSVTPMVGSLTGRQSLDRAVRHVEVLFHVAADYRFWVPDPRTMYDVNVGGTKQLLDLAWKAGVGRIVYTSSTLTVRCSTDHLGTEEDFLLPSEARRVYQRTKILAEQAAWRLIGEGAPITIVNPSTPIGACDRRPTPTGRLIVDFLNGRKSNMPSWSSSGASGGPKSGTAGWRRLRTGCRSAVGWRICTRCGSGSWPRSRRPVYA